MKLKIINMLDMQEAANTRVDPNWRSAGFEWYRAIWMQASGMLEHYGWKWWVLKDPDVIRAKHELVDIVQAGLSIRLLQASSIESAAAAIAVNFMNPVSTYDIRSSVELLVKATLKDHGAHFSVIAGVMSLLNMRFDELYEIYAGRYVLNIFRRNNGYQEGSYITSWAGKEDNEHLIDIQSKLDNNSQLYREDIYNALEQIYPAYSKCV